MNKFILYHSHKVSKLDRIRIKNHNPCAIWLTGLPSSGKSTIANELEYVLNSKYKVHSYILDGDNIRQGLNKDLGFSREDRAENIRRVAEVAKLFVDAGLVVITAFISPYKKNRELAKNIIGKDEFIEVYVKCPLDICEQRDPKGLYKKARAGEIKNFTGISDPYEEPDNPDIVLETHKLTVSECVNKIIDYIKGKGII